MVERARLDRDPAGAPLGLMIDAVAALRAEGAKLFAFCRRRRTMELHIPVVDAEINSVDDKRHLKGAARLMLAFGAVAGHLLDWLAIEFVANGVALAFACDVHDNLPQLAIRCSHWSQLASSMFART
jgi:hypothetical protein